MYNVLRCIYLPIVPEKLGDILKIYEKNKFLHVSND